LTLNGEGIRGVDEEDVPRMLWKLFSASKGMSSFLIPDYAAVVQPSCSSPFMVLHPVIRRSSI